MQSKLNQTFEIAGKDKKCRFNNLMHLLNKENLKECFHKLRRIFKNELTSKHNIVISRSTTEIKGATVFSSIGKAYKFAKTTKKTIYCIGGAAIYKLCLPIADKMYLSYIKGDYKGDTYFPEFDASDWEIEKMKNHQNFEFLIYKRISPTVKT